MPVGEKAHCTSSLTFRASTTAQHLTHRAFLERSSCRQALLAKKVGHIHGFHGLTEEKPLGLIASAIHKKICFGRGFYAFSYDGEA